RCGAAARPLLARVASTKRCHQISEQLVTEADVISQQIECRVAIACDYCINNGLMFFRCEAQCVRSLELVRAVRCEPIVERTSLRPEILIVRARVDCVVKSFVQCVITFAVSGLDIGPEFAMDGNQVGMFRSGHAASG